MQRKYFIHILKSIPLLPIIYFQGKKLKKEIPLLPAAKNPTGCVNINAEKTLKIIFIGESSFVGVGSEFHQNSFAGHFSTEISARVQYNINWRVYAKIGYNVNQIHNKIIPQIEESSCNLLIIGIGGNDTFELTQPKNWNRKIRLLIEDLQSKFPNTPILFAHLPTVETFPAFSKQMRFVMANHKNILADHLGEQVLKYQNVFYPTAKINVKEWMKHLKEGENLSTFFSDGIHPSELTYQLWAKDCVDYLVDSNISFN